MSAQETWFPDRDLTDFVSRMYGASMALRVAQIFDLDPRNETGFANSIRRSLTREIERSAAVSVPVPPPSKEEGA